MKKSGEKSGENCAHIKYCLQIKTNVQKIRNKYLVDFREDNRGWTFSLEEAWIIIS